MRAVIDNKGFGLEFGGSAPVSVRETLWGFVVQSSARHVGWRNVAGKIARFCAFAVWLVVAGLWMMPLSPGIASAFVVKSFVSVAMIAAVYAGVVLTRRGTGYEIHVDANRRELRVAEVGAKSQIWIKASYRFDEIAELVLERHRRESALVMRLQKVAGAIPVALGDEPTLLAVRDRLMAALRPVDESMSAAALARQGGRRPRARPAFPALAPAESESRGRRLGKV